MKKIAYLITGDDSAHLQKHTPYSRKKIQVLGWTLLLPAFLWFMTGTLLAQNLLDMIIHILDINNVRVARDFISSSHSERIVSFAVI